LLLKTAKLLFLFYFFATISEKIFFQRLFFALRLGSARITYNGMAAWRSGGIFALPFKSARPAAVAPNRSL